jgi:membrane dipeptidase
MPSRQQNALYERSIVIDTTAPTPPFAPFATTLSPDERVNAYSGSGVTFAVFTLVDDYPNSIEQTLKLIAANRQYFLSHSDKFTLADKSEDIRKAKAAGKLAVAFAFQGSNALLGELALVEAYRRLGVIQMLLAYNSGNLAADGCHENRNAGLSRFGRNLVAEMNRVGMIVDVTHVGLRSSLEAIELATKPPVFSHSAPAKFASHARNITDEQIRACASKRGVICLPGIGLFLDPREHKATVSKLADAIEYVIQLVGPQHAAIGLDYVIDADAMARYVRANAALYGGGAQYPVDGHIDSLAPSSLPELTNELLRRRHSETEVRGVLGENYLRVLDANQ